MSTPTVGTADPYAGDYYLSDDKEARIRANAPVPCRICQSLFVKQSPIVDAVVTGCEIGGEAPLAEIVGKLAMRLAESGRCDFMTPLPLLPKGKRRA